MESDSGVDRIDDPRVSIIVVTYGTGPVVVDALDAIRANTSVPHEVIVVDNPTEAGHTTADLLRAAGRGDRPGERLLEPSQNLGFGGGNNHGAAAAEGEFLCFLNPDVIVGPGWLEPLIGALDDPAVGIAGPPLLNPDGTVQEAGQLLYDDACTAAIGGPEVLPNDRTQLFSRDVDYVSAACWVVRRGEFAALGGFDERYFPAFFEDVDVAMRVEANGQRTRLIVDVPVVHHHGLGGAGPDLELGARSQATFRERWADTLPSYPRRPTSDLEAIANRDRLATGTSAWVVRGVSTAVRCRALAEAMERSLGAPRDRVTFATDSVEGIDVDAARRAGVEVVDADESALRARPNAPSFDWHVVEGGANLGLRSALRSLWSPWTVLVALVGIVLRVLILRSPAGYLNSDEAYTGLASMDVLDGRFPVVLGGNRYTAVFEAYMFAPVSATIGQSILALKLVPVVFWALAGVVTYLAADHLAGQVDDGRGATVGRRVAAVAGSFVWLTPGALLIVSTLAYPSYALGMAVVVGTLLWAARVIDRDEPDVVNSAILGALAGLGFYAHPMFLAGIVPLIVPVAWVHRRDVRRFWAPSVVGGLVACGPFLLWNIVNDFPSLEVQNALPGTYTERLSTFFRELIPRGYGLRDTSFAWILGPAVGVTAYVALVAAAITGCVLLVRRGERRSRWLLPIVLVAVWPLMALFSPLIWSADGRYNIISFPFVAIAVAMAIASVPWRDRRLTVAAIAAVALWCAVCVWPHTSRTIAGGAVNANANSEAVIDLLDERGFEHIAGSYWRVLVLEYLSDRDILGAVSWPDPVRFPESQRVVEAQPPEDVAFVFPTWAERPEMLWMPADRYERVVVGDTVIYFPLPES